MADCTKIGKARGQSQVGFLQGPNESDESFAKRAEFCSTFRDPKADDHLLGWIPLYYTNKGLSFFEGGATFIDEREGVVFPLIHLRKAFKNKDHWLFYDKEEILQHELVHAMRCTFEEPKIEEFIAYQTSKLSYRKFFGPLFTSPKEIFFFLSSLALPFFFSELIFLAIPLVTLGGFLFRLALRQKKFKALLSKYPTWEERLKLEDRHLISKTN